MASPTGTARMRVKLAQWSDDDEDDSLPRRTERVASLSPSEDQSISREPTQAEPSPSPSIPIRKRISRAACLESDEDDEVFPVARTWSRKVDPPSPSPQPRNSSRGGSESLFSPPTHHVFSTAPPSEAGPTMQPPIQPGCTRENSGKRRFLSYNMLGSITSVENEGFAHVEVDFHDIGRGLRVPSMTDYFGFTLAAMNEKGSVFANPQKGEKNPSTIMYRPFNSWTSNSEWSMRFPVEEEVKAVAIGNEWAAAATSKNFLRVYSEAGLQKFVMSLAGPVVALAGNQEQLVVVTHASNPLPTGDQVLEFALLDVREQRRLLAGRVPLSPHSTLAWLGFSETGSLSVYDSQGVLRVYSEDYNGCWIPLFSAAAERKTEKDNFWLVGLNSTQIFCVVCKAPNTEPQVIPKPVLGVFNTALPVVHSDLGADDLENDFLRGTLHLTHTRAKADEAAASGREDEEEENVLKMEAELDRCLLRLIAAACKGDKLARALELSTQLSLHKSMEGAIKLVNAMRLPALAERLNLLLEERISREMSEGGGATQKGQVFGAQRSSIPTYKPTLVSSSQGPQAQPRSVLTDIVSIRGAERVASLASPTTNPPPDVMCTQPATLRPLRSTFMKSHKKFTAHAIETEVPNLPSEDGNSGDDSRAPLSEASTAPQASFNSLKNFRPSNPFAKKVNAPKVSEDKNESILLSLKNMHSEPEGKRKGDSVSSQQRPLKMGKAG